MEPATQGNTGLISGSIEEAIGCLRTFDSPESKKRFLACLRTSVGVASVYYSPLSAIAGASLTLVSPSLAERIVATTDGAVSGLWNGMNVLTRLGLTAGGVIFLSMDFSPIPLTAATVFFACKLGAEVAIVNYNR